MTVDDLIEMLQRAKNRGVPGGAQIEVFVECIDAGDHRVNRVEDISYDLMDVTPMLSLTMKPDPEASPINVRGR